MAVEAERLLQGTGWLPEPLRVTEAADAPIVQTEENEDLPDFLGDDEDTASLDAEEDASHATAAE